MVGPLECGRIQRVRTAVVVRKNTECVNKASVV